MPAVQSFISLTQSVFDALHGIATFVKIQARPSWAVGWKGWGDRAFNTGQPPVRPRAEQAYAAASVLWGMLGSAGKLNKKGRAGLNAFVRSRFEGKWKSVPIDIDTLRDAGQINDVTRALKDWCKREGIKTERSKA